MGVGDVAIASCVVPKEGRKGVRISLSLAPSVSLQLSVAFGFWKTDTRVGGLALRPVPWPGSPGSR